MSAALLREAADLMRERAGGAACVIGDVWRMGDRSTLYTLEAQGNDDVWRNAFECGPCSAWNESGEPKHEYVGGSEEVAEHIASWSPVIALRVAEWLEAMAAVEPVTVWPDEAAKLSAMYEAGKQVARAYLNREAS